MTEKEEIKNLNGTLVNREGDFGEDEQGLLYCIKDGEWKCVNPQKREVNFWKKKYEELLK